MIYYKNGSNEVSAYEDDVDDSFIQHGLLKISEDEAIEIIQSQQKIFVPNVLSEFQAKAILLMTPITIDGIESNLYDETAKYINSLPSDTLDNRTIKLAWTAAREFFRDSPTILLAQKMFNLTDEQVDNMFISGSKIKA